MKFLGSSFNENETIKIDVKKYKVVGKFPNSFMSFWCILYIMRISLYQNDEALPFYMHLICVMNFHTHVIAFSLILISASSLNLLVFINAILGRGLWQT